MQKENKSLDFLIKHIGHKMSKGLSPFGRWIDGKLLEASEGNVKIEIEVRNEMCNPIGTLHGGAIAGIMDEIMGIAVFSLGREYFYSTINLSIDYFAVSKENETIVAKSLVIKPGKNIIHVQGELWDSSEKKLLAKSTSNLFKVNNDMKNV